jgi:hypothetical protein
MLGAGACFSVVLSAFRYTAGFRGHVPGSDDEEEVERREKLKKARRRPISETIDNIKPLQSMLLTILGIYAPGYEERRRQRLLAKYGVDVKAAQEAA